MLASAVCVVEQVIGIPWGSYPIKMFGVLNGRTELFTDPPCLLDKVSHKIRSLATQVSKDELSTVVIVLANDFTMDISQIEAKHASTRRILHMRTVQVSLPSLEDVSASWVCRNNVLDREDRMPCSKHDDRTHGTKPERTEGNQSGRQTSSWDIFVHEYFTGQKGQKWAKSDMKKCSEQFALLDENEQERLRKEAVEANLKKNLATVLCQRQPVIVPCRMKCKSCLSLNLSIQKKLFIPDAAIFGMPVSWSLVALQRVRKKMQGNFKLTSTSLMCIVCSLSFWNFCQTLFRPLFRAVPAENPTVDLHLPADSLTQDQQTLMV